MFIAMDPPVHDDQRKTVQGSVAPANLKLMEETIRSRTQKVLDDLPVGEQFDWVDKVSIELTTQMLATLFDFPFEDRRKLTRWSDVATGDEESGIVESEEARQAELYECLEYFMGLWKERAEKGEGNDLVSMLAHGEATKDMSPQEFLGNLILLIVGALNQNPGEYAKLRNNPGVIPNMVSEIIRWQTPLAHMRRIANKDYELDGQTIKAGDKVVMWYLSGNRDERSIDRPNEFIIDRARARQHLSFGFGVHRCMGNRLAEMQLRILWEEVQKRFHMVEVIGEPTLVPSNFVHGYTEMQVVLHPH
jgi:cytochrome P450